MAAILLAMAALALATGPAAAGRGSTPKSRFAIPASARQLIVVSSRTYDPPNYLATFRTYQRVKASAPWKRVFSTWQAEIGSGDLRDARREGDHATPTGVYALSRRAYGDRANPGGLNDWYHRLVCGDWWDEDPYSNRYNRFVHVRCGSTPNFAAWSEPLWTETTAYPYLVVIEYNDNPTIGGVNAPGSGIFLHAWMNGATQGCIALPIPRLLRVMRWLNPVEHPYIEIGTNAEVGRVPPAAG
ncbi:MAG: L,D-transpeptidase family protein [Acidimicrobiales bacterium]|jgi:L,D-peptidoglycan transpeptidase YkuD (ErfK/YbiS/YcfS/YnhG family)